MRKLTVTAGVCIDASNRVLCVQRPNRGPLALKWEFPGGKVEDGETLEASLIRELKEELSLQASIKAYITTVHSVDETIDLTLHVYEVDANSDDLILHEHLDYRWQSVGKLHELDLAKADRAALSAIEDYIRQKS